MSDPETRGERFRRLGKHGDASKSGSTVDLFEHFGVDEAPGSKLATPATPRAPPAAVEARPCRRCTWLCAVSPDTGAAQPCPNCGLEPLPDAEP